MTLARSLVSKRRLEVGSGELVRFKFSDGLVWGIGTEVNSDRRGIVIFTPEGPRYSETIGANTRNNGNENVPVLSVGKQWELRVDPLAIQLPGQGDLANGVVLIQDQTQAIVVKAWSNDPHMPDYMLNLATHTLHYLPDDRRDMWGIQFWQIWLGSRQDDGISVIGYPPNPDLT